jgi:cytochrome c biogenesis protein ResB
MPLGLHRAYASPLFLALAGLLALCTAACAVERTKRSLRLMRSTTRPLSDAGLERLRTRPQMSFRVADAARSNAALSTAAERLRRLGLRVRCEEGLADGHSGGVGLLGSPVFHWSLVALMLVVAAGQATRAEGFLALPLGKRIVDERASYLQVSEGPLFGERYTGLEFVASSLERNLHVHGIDRGAVPFITVYRAGIEVVSGRVYANNPLRTGPLMIHMVDFGPDVTLSLESTGGAEIARESFHLDRSSETSSGTKPQEFALISAPGGIEARVEVVARRTSSADRSSATASRAILEISTAGTGAYSAPVVLPVGDAIELPNGQRLRIADVSDWVRVSVVNDWSVPFIYALLVIAIGALTIALLLPTRRATVLLAEHEDGLFLHVSTWHSSKAPSFRERVEQAVRAAASPEETE